MKIRLPGFGRFDAHVEPYNEFPSVEDIVGNSIARVAGYDDNEQLFRFIRSNKLGSLKVVIETLEPIAWFTGYNATFGNANPINLRSYFSPPFPRTIWLIKALFTANTTAPECYIFIGSQYVLRFSLTSYTQLNLDLLGAPIPITVPSDTPLRLQTTVAGPIQMSWNICLLGNVG